MAFTAETADTLDQRRALRRHRTFATALLVAMAIVYIAVNWSGETGFWIGLVAAGAEAAMVGGLADWFAVTAMFRHPLGIPIPHTAIIPTRKDQIGRSLGAFLQANFLSGPVVSERLLASRADPDRMRPRSCRRNRSRWGRNAPRGKTSGSG